MSALSAHLGLQMMQMASRDARGRGRARHVVSVARQQVLDVTPFELFAQALACFRQGQIERDDTRDRVPLESDAGKFLSRAFRDDLLFRRLLSDLTECEPPQDGISQLA